MQEQWKEIAFYPANILLPKKVDWSKWAVVACDQFTSEPEYWESVGEIVGEEKSTLKMVLPEAKLHNPNLDEEIKKINTMMWEYLEKDVFQEYQDALIYVERTQSDGRIRHGMIGMIDLEEYAFVPGNQALIRATEGTVLSRIPPRVYVRENAPLELPHIMLLIDDPSQSIIEELKEYAIEKLYDFALQKGGGKVQGYLLNKKAKNKILNGFKKLKRKEEMEKKYQISTDFPMLFAVGDGNHSLATAKQCYEEQKKRFPKEEWKCLPSRYALAEVVNIHDKALEFEPIHRVVFGVNPQEVLEELQKFYPESYKGRGEGHIISYCYQGEEGDITIPNPNMQLPVGSLQSFLDFYISIHSNIKIDYIHGEHTVFSLGTKKGNMGFLLPVMKKQELFKTVMTDGILPRKTFSMGYAQDKRYYIESRKIR